MSAETAPHGQSQIEVHSFYVRERHCMALWTDLGPVFTDYYLHLMQNEMRYSPEHDVMLKDALAAMTLHLAARPRDELSAWTINLNRPVLNLFVTGDSQAGTVCGRVFTEDVKVGPTSLFFGQSKRARLPDRNSTVEVTGADLLSLAEQYYAQSEQLPARYFRLGGDSYGMVVAQPDHDPAWFAALDVERVRALQRWEGELPVVHAAGEELRLLEVRRYQFGCGCNQDLIHSVLAPMARAGFDELFEGAERIRIQCPRCGGRFKVSQADMRAWLDAHSGGKSS